MSSEGRFTFHCPACQRQLTTPLRFAGQIGPCPGCQTLIEAPHPKPTPELEETPQPAEEPAGLRPKPVVATTRVRYDQRDELSTRVKKRLLQRHPRSRVMLFIVPMILLCLVFGVVYGVKFFLSGDRRGPSEKTTETKEIGETLVKTEPVIPTENEASDSPPKEPEVQGAAVVEPPLPEIAAVSENTPPALPPNLRAVDGGIAARALLEDFLAMKTFGERLPHIESKRPQSELTGSVLTGPLPEVLKITVDVRETNTLGQFVDYYYLVDFADASGGINPQTLLVRTRGAGTPKVMVDAFLDLFGGRFARFAEKPTEESGTFQVIISAGAFCRDDVPAPEAKYTLKILSRDDTEEIASAYFGKSSKIGEMLEDETSGLAYGQAKPCTVLMRWNMDEDPEKPFLEALDIKALNWSP